MRTMMLSELEALAHKDFNAAVRLALGFGHPPPLFRLPDGRSVFITKMEMMFQGERQPPRIVMTYDEWKPARPIRSPAA